jgi:hypothetical protein
LAGEKDLELFFGFFVVSLYRVEKRIKHL